MANNYQGGDDVSFDSLYKGILGAQQYIRETVSNRAKEQQKQIAKENIELSKSLDKVNIDGLQQKDLKEFNDKWAEVKNIAFDIYSTTDPSERMAKEWKRREAVREAQAIVSNSKQQGKDLATKADFFMKNADKYDMDKVRARLDQLSNTPTSQITPELLDFTDFKFKYDGAKAKKSIQTTVKDALKRGEGEWDKSFDIRDAGRGFDEISQTEVGQLGQDVAIEVLNGLYEADRNIKNFIDEEYGGDPLNYYTANEGEFRTQTSSSRFSRRPVRTGRKSGTSDAELSMAFNNFQRDVEITVGDNKKSNFPIYANLGGSGIKTVTPSDKVLRNQDGKPVTLKANTEVQVTGVGLMPKYQGRFIVDKERENRLREQGLQIDYEPTVILRYQTSRGHSSVFAEPQYAQSLTNSKVLNTQLNALSQVMQGYINTGDTPNRPSPITNIQTQPQQTNQTENRQTPSRNVSKLVDLIKGK